MVTLMKLLAGTAIALGILTPGFAPRADTCECKAKAAISQINDWCEEEQISPTLLLFDTY
jgi:hypothetical protein